MFMVVGRRADQLCSQLEQTAPCPAEQPAALTLILPTLTLHPTYRLRC